jgi:hypothetical protein
LIASPKAGPWRGDHAQIGVVDVVEQHAVHEDAPALEQRIDGFALLQRCRKTRAAASARPSPLPGDSI